MYYAMSFYVCVCAVYVYSMGRAAGWIYTDAVESGYIIQTHSSRSLSTV
jgi:hypothetical protein